MELKHFILAKLFQFNFSTIIFLLITFSFICNYCVWFLLFTLFPLVGHNRLLLRRARAIEIRQQNQEAVGGFFSQIGSLYTVHHLWGKKFFYLFKMCKCLFLPKIKF